MVNNGTCALGQHLQFWEYGSTDQTGAPIDTSTRLACSHQLTAAEAALWSDPATVLSGWEPGCVARMSGVFSSRPVRSPEPSSN